MYSSVFRSTSWHQQARGHTHLSRAQSQGLGTHTHTCLPPCFLEHHCADRFTHPSRVLWCSCAKTNSSSGNIGRYNKTFVVYIRNSTSTVSICMYDGSNCWKMKKKCDDILIVSIKNIFQHGKS